jgi:hypothetical protein
MAMKFSELVGGAAIFGLVGWGIENVLFGPRYSAVFGDRKIPFLPIYAAGGATVLAVAPTLKAQGLPWPVRAAAYAGILTGIEWTGCQLDRKTLGARSWDYGDEAPAEGCIDVKHAVAWGALGLIAESFQSGGGSARDR